MFRDLSESNPRSYKQRLIGSSHENLEDPLPNRNVCYVGMSPNRRHTHKVSARTWNKIHMYYSLKKTSEMWVPVKECFMQ